MTESDAVRRVLVTGASGFIGRHTLEPLMQRGYEVIATHGAARPYPLEGVTWLQSDLLAPGAAAALAREVRASHLLHMAWYVEPGKMIASTENIRWISASLELIRAFHEAGGKRCAVSGSCYEYDWRHGYLSSELTPRIPDTLYGCAKNGLFEAFRGYCAATGLSGAWGRIFFLYGPWENPRRLVSSVILSLLSGREALSSHGQQIRDYMHVQDAADGLVALLDSDAVGDYDIATGTATSLRSIVEKLGELTGRTDLLRIGALPARANDLPLVVGNPAKFQRSVHWQPRFNLSSGLADTVEWWRRNLNSAKSDKGS